MGFFLIIQAKYYISNAAMNLLINFFSVLLRIIAQFSPFVGTITKGFYTSFNSMCKSIDHNESYTKYVVCPSCNQIYQFEQSINTVGTEQYSKKCQLACKISKPSSTKKTSTLWFSFIKDCGDIFIRKKTTTPI